jgi:hypothetical protein
MEQGYSKKELYKVICWACCDCNTSRIPGRYHAMSDDLIDATRMYGLLHLAQRTLPGGLRHLLSGDLQ